LRYAKSKTPFSLELGEEQSMTGNDEAKVTYPEFHNLPNGKLLFCYRSGASGRGNMILKLYDVKTQKWTSLRHNLINGENQRSAYWQMCVGKKEFICRGFGARAGMFRLIMIFVMLFRQMEGKPVKNLQAKNIIFQ
jgi:hypothetical protein